MTKPKTKSEMCADWRRRNPDKVKEYSKKYYLENRERLRANDLRVNNPKYYGGITQGYANTAIGWCKYKTNSLRRSAKIRGLEFSLRWEDIKILMVDKCPVLGIDLDYSLGGYKGKIRPYSPSVDRIDNTRGYTPDNIIIVSQLVNKVKHNLSLSGLQEVFPKIVSFYKVFLLESNINDQ